MTKAEELPKSKAAGRVLLYLRAGEDVSIIRNMLAGMAAEGTVCADIQDLCRQMTQEDVNAILLAESALADGALRLLAEALQNQPQWSDLPTLFVAGGGLDSPVALQVMRELPNVLVLDRPVRMAALASALQMAWRTRDKQRQVRDLLEERRRSEEALEKANERLHAQADELAGLNEQLLTERDELQRQAEELWKQSLELRELKEQAEQTARAMEQLARTVEENPDSVLRVWADGRIHYKNPASFLLCRRWNSDERLRVPWAVQELVSEAYGRMEIIRREMTFGKHTYLITVAPAPPPAQYVNVFASDITARKQAEKMREQLLQEVEQQRARLQAVLDALPVGVWVADASGKMVMVNDAAAEIYGGKAPVLNRIEEYSVYKIWWPGTRERIAVADYPLVRALRGEAVQDTVLDFERFDGTRGTHITSSTPIRDAQGNLLGGVVVALDITTLKRTEEALRELNATLESRVAQRTAELRHRTRQLQKLTLEMSEAEERERERLAHILHEDLQQELAAAKFHLSIARSRIKDDASVRELVATVVELLKDAIGKSRNLSHELSPVVLHQGDFAEALQWLASQMQAKHGLTVHVHGRAHLPSDGTKAFLFRTAQELLFNAVKHAQVREARVRVRPYRGHVCLSVSDRGRGFDPAQLQETTGFGLLSIRERIELLGGRMKIRSTPGQGSTFFVVVPGDERTRQLAGRAAGVSPAGEAEGRLRVLLADDHEVVRQGLIALLGEEETLEVVGEAANGQEAVDLAERLHPDVVLMDVSMPVMSGEEAARRIKQDLPRTRIVSLSMREEPEVRERMHQAGAESYVLKTAPYKELLAAIRGGDQSPRNFPYESAA